MVSCRAVSSSIGRRQVLGSLLGVSVAALGARPAAATTAVALTLQQLVGQSHRVLLGTPEATSSQWESIGGSRRIVSYTRLVVDEDVDGTGDGVCLVRTLGGAVGELGQIVHGEAQLRAGSHTLVFLRRGGGGALVVTGRAQGHFPLRADARGVVRLRPSPSLPELIGAEDGAVKRLVNRTLDEARGLVREAATRR